jgi:hypothetical protein
VRLSEEPELITKARLPGVEELLMDFSRIEGEAAE